MATLDLVQVWHLHQPATQTRDWVDRAVGASYRPLLEAYGRHPDVRYNLNVTGSLVDQLEKEHPEVLKLAAQGVTSGSLEPTTSGYYQPIIPFIPRDHAIAQVQRNTQRVEEVLHHTPRAAWVPERAWEPWMPEVFQGAGVQAVLLDDHLLTSPAGPTVKYGPWEARHNGSSVSVYLIDEEMRYYIPWKPVKEVMARLEEIADATQGGAVVTFADDGEKMGLWPGTENIHPWLEEFLRAVEDRPWLRTTTLEQYLKRQGTRGEGKFKAGSYVEMEEWCLGDLRNWLRHPLVRDMYGRLQLAVREFSSGGIPEAILRAEVNDPYWYARRMTYHRQEVYRNILLAEEGKARAPAAAMADFNGDGADEALLQAGDERVFVGSDGRIYEWDHRAVGHNFVNTGFLDLAYQEDKALPGPEVFALPRRNCLTDFLDGQVLLGQGLGTTKDRASVHAQRGPLGVTKELALEEGGLRVTYLLRNGGRAPVEGQLAVEVCFTPPTDTVEASIRPYHRQVFDYAGAVVDRPVEFARDGPGVAWAAVEDRRHGVVAGAAWRPGGIVAHGRGIAAEGCTSTPVFPIRLAPGGEGRIDLRLAVGKGDHGIVAGLLKDLI